MRKLISVVFSAYNEDGNIQELARQLKEVFDVNKEYDFEVIMVDNGSTDATFEKMFSVREMDKRFKIVQLSRTFGMDRGVTAGLGRAKGEAAIIMTANLQDTPSLITQFIKKWQDGYENVYGVVKKRPGKGFIRRLFSELFYFLINRMTKNLIPKNVSDFRLIDKKVYLAINSMPERNRLLRGMFAWAGFKSTGIEFERSRRFSGKSHASFFATVDLAIRGIFAYSYFPIRLISAFGFIFSGISFFCLLYTVVKVLIKGVPFPGYGTLISLILLMFGLLFMVLGVLGQYIAQIYEEVKARPNYLIRQEIGF